MVGERAKVEGVWYEARQGDGCKGCAAAANSMLCGQMPGMCSSITGGQRCDLIWVVSNCQEVEV